jgi:hypothetical protein
MNQAAITEHVMRQLKASAERDPFAWYPAVDWLRDGNAQPGLAVELFGKTQTDHQLDQLARVLFRLATQGIIEAARFRTPHGYTRLADRPVEQGQQTAYSLISVGSRSLDVPSNRYGVRLAVEI